MNSKLTLVELIELLAESTSTSKRVCELFLRELFSTVSQELIKGETVKIKNIGTFKITNVKPRKSVSVVDGEDIEISGHKRITFTPDKSLAEAVNQPFAQFESVVLDDAVTDEKLAALDEKYPSIALESHLEEDAQSAVAETPTTPSVEDTPAAPAAQEPAVEEKIETPTPEPVEPEPVVAKPVEPEPVVAKPVVPEPVIAKPVEPGPAIAKPVEPEPVEPKPIERKPMLVGIPIDGPSHPVPERAPVEEPVVDDRFYRPALRDAYSPTEEQLSSTAKKDHKWWLWALLAAVVVGGLLWFLLSRGGSAEPADIKVLDTAEAYTEEPAVVTDTITSQIVLTVLSEKYYGSPWFWVYIYEENKDKISNPNNVRPGTEVVIPPAEKYGIDAKDSASLKKAQRRSWEILTLGKR